MPYSDQVIDLIDEICAERLPEHLTADVRAERVHQREVLAEHAREVTAARERLDGALARADELSEEERLQADADIDLVHGRYSIDGHKLRKQLTPTETGDPGVGEDVVDDEAVAAA